MDYVAPVIDGNQMIKDNCQSCGRDLAGKNMYFDRERYFQDHGNFCKECRRKPTFNPKGFKISEDMRMNNEIYERLRETVEEELKTGYPPSIDMV